MYKAGPKLFKYSKSMCNNGLRGYRLRECSRERFHSNSANNSEAHESYDVENECVSTGQNNIDIVWNIHRDEVETVQPTSE